MAAIKFMVEWFGDLVQRDNQMIEGNRLQYEHTIENARINCVVMRNHYF